MSNFSVTINDALQQVKRSNYYEMPFLIEAIVNSIEANAKNISLTFQHTSDNINLTILDDGDGFNEDNYARFKSLFDKGKQKKNKGCGRLQYLHFFEKCSFFSKYKNNDIINNRQFEFSRNGLNEILAPTLIQNQSIVNTGVELFLVSLSIKLDKKKKILEKLQNLSDLKNEILNLCFYKFALLGENMPVINIIYGDKNEAISKSDLNYTKEEDTFDVKKIKLECISDSKEEIVETKNIEKFNIITYCVPSDIFKENAIYLCSKDIPVLNITKHIIEPQFVFLNKNDNVKNNRYICFVSGVYFDDDNIVNASRDNFNIPKSDKELKSNTSLFDVLDENIGYIVLSRLIDKLRSKLENAIQEIKTAKDLKNNEIQVLGANLGCDAEEIKEVQREASLTTSTDDIIKKLGTKKGIKNIANQKNINEEFKKFKTYTDFNQTERVNMAKQIVLHISEQNKTDLSQYVIRRQIEVELLNEFIKNNVIESCIHNLIFQKGTGNKTNSEHNLWMVNEDFANYDYITSESSLKEILDGNEISDDDIKNALKSYGVESDNEVKKRPDIAIFHAIKTVILIEFKKPDVLHSKYVYQLDVYTRLLAEFSKGKFDKFYCFLIGGDTIGILPSAYNFKETPDQEGFFSNINIKSLDNKREIGTMYMEVQKYSRLQNLAKLRNSNFAKKLCNIDDIQDIVNKIATSIQTEEQNSKSTKAESTQPTPQSVSTQS